MVHMSLRSLQTLDSLHPILFYSLRTLRGGIHLFPIIAILSQHFDANSAGKYQCPAYSSFGPGGFIIVEIHGCSSTSVPRLLDWWTSGCRRVISQNNRRFDYLDVGKVHNMLLEEFGCSCCWCHFVFEGRRGVLCAIGKY
jgi:hypothetical protein